MIDIKISLIVAASNLVHPGDTKVLLIDDSKSVQVISKIFDESNDLYINEVAANLLKKHTGLEARIQGVGWIDLTQSTVVDKINSPDHCIIIPFGCLIPETTEALEGTNWITVSNLFKQDTRRINANDLELVKEVLLNI